MQFQPRGKSSDTVPLIAPNGVSRIIIAHVRGGRGQTFELKQCSDRRMLQGGYLAELQTNQCSSRWRICLSPNAVNKFFGITVLES